MEWTRQDEESFAELMEEYARVEPAIERMTEQDRALARVQGQLRSLTARVRKIEGKRC